ncbi:MAG: electron transfer flavoprotein subunit beta/FixA family protein [Planctomycetes bacterium]|nr:electron transfer flavoprotein subunit beta/FixA family protein [Planctomycetota bacterium]
MKIAVCIKRVPDTTAKVRIAADGKTVDPAGVEWVIGPYEEIALEAALKLKEAGKAEKVTVLCLGPKEATKELRTALAMGADDAVLLVDGGGERDAAAVAGALAAEAKGLGADLLLFGWKAIDTDQASVPHLAAAILERPCVSFVTKLEAGDGRLLCHREVEGGTEALEVPLPCVLTAQKGLAEPRYASLKGIMAAKKKPLVEKPAPAAAAAVRTERLSLPPERPPGRILGQGVDAVPELVRLLRDEAKLL